MSIPTNTMRVHATGAQRQKSATNPDDRQSETSKRIWRGGGGACLHTHTFDCYPAEERPTRHVAFAGATKLFDWVCVYKSNVMGQTSHSHRTSHSSLIRPTDNIHNFDRKKINHFVFRVVVSLSKYSRDLPGDKVDLYGFGRFAQAIS